MAPGPDGTAGGSFEFFGISDSFIEWPNSAGGPLDVRYSVTMLCWVYYDGQDGPLFNYRNTGDKLWGVHLWANGGARLFARFTRRDYSFTDFLMHPSLAGGWKFVGASYDGSTGEAKLWVNGFVVQTLNIGTGLDLATQDPVVMGAKIEDGRHFKGRIAQMQVYNGALSQKQIKAIQQMTQVSGENAVTLSSFKPGLSYIGKIMVDQQYLRSRSPDSYPAGFYESGGKEEKMRFY